MPNKTIKLTAKEESQRNHIKDLISKIPELSFWKNHQDLLNDILSDPESRTIVTATISKHYGKTTLTSKLNDAEKYLVDNSFLFDKNIVTAIDRFRNTVKAKSMLEIFHGGRVGDTKTNKIRVFDDKTPTILAFQWMGTEMKAGRGFWFSAKSALDVAGNKQEQHWRKINLDPIAIPEKVKNFKPDVYKEVAKEIDGMVDEATFKRSSEYKTVSRLMKSLPAMMEKMGTTSEAAFKEQMTKFKAAFDKASAAFIKKHQKDKVLNEQDTRTLDAIGRMNYMLESVQNSTRMERDRDNFYIGYENFCFAREHEMILKPDADKIKTLTDVAHVKDLENKFRENAPAYQKMKQQKAAMNVRPMAAA